MIVRLEKYVDDAWWKYGDYNTSDASQMNALAQAAFMHGTHEIPIRVRELKDDDTR